MPNQADYGQILSKVNKVHGLGQSKEKAGIEIKESVGLYAVHGKVDIARQHDEQYAAARARLSGLLIGMELAAAKPYWLGQPVTLIGAEKLSATYARALAAQGVTAQRLSVTDCTLAGLASLSLQHEATPE